MGNRRSKIVSSERMVVSDMRYRIYFLHKLVLDGDFKYLGMVLNGIKYSIGQLRGMSLYHSFIIGIVYNREYEIERMFEVLREYQNIIGDVMEESHGNRNIVIGSYMKWSSDSDTRFVESYKFISFVSKYDIGGRFYDREVLGTGFLGETYVRQNIYNVRQYMLVAHTPLMFALNIRDNKIIMDKLRLAINLLRNLQDEQQRHISEFL